MMMVVGLVGMSVFYWFWLMSWLDDDGKSGKLHNHAHGCHKWKYSHKIQRFLIPVKL